MVRRLENAGVAVAGLRGRNKQTVFRRSQRYIAESLLKETIEVVPTVTVFQDVNPEASEPLVAAWREYLPTLLCIEFGKGFCRPAGRQAQGDDAAGRGAGNQVEVVADGLAVQAMLFQPGQDDGGENAFDPAAVDGKDLKRLVVVPLQEPAFGCQDGIRPALGFLFGIARHCRSPFIASE